MTRDSGVGVGVGGELSRALEARAAASESLALGRGRHLQRRRARANGGVYARGADAAVEPAMRGQGRLLSGSGRAAGCGGNGPGDRGRPR